MPADVIANGPLAEKVCTPPVSSLSEVMPDPPEMQLPFTW